jgi:Ca2+-binding EF-hand superfamily protein
MKRVLKTKKHFQKKSSTDGESSDDDTIVEEIFEKYSENGIMKSKDFVSFIEKLKEVDINLKVEGRTPKAVFYLMAESKKVTLVEFKEWWFCDDKYSFFSGKKAELILKAYDLFDRYSSHEKMDLDNFLEMMVDLKLKGTEDDFDTLDFNEDGGIDFREFCEWLSWF